MKFEMADAELIRRYQDAEKPKDQVRRHALECLVSGAYRHWPGFKQEDGE